MTSASARSGAGASPAIAVLVAVAAVGYALLVHHGVGATGNGPILHWWQPRGWFFTMEAFDSLLAEPWLATIVFATPAFLIFLAAAGMTRSAVSTTVALAALFFVLLCCFYGLGGGRRAVWGFFHWRGSAVMALFALVLAGALLAPFLARSWLRLGWAARLALYLPVAALVMLAIRDVTGTDPTLPFAISPWPVVPMFGLEIGALGVAAALAVLALGFAGVSLARTRNIGGAALATGAGAALVALPIFGGQALVARDYEVTRNDRAQQIVSALEAYYAREAVYPDSLEELVEKKDLAAIPAPDVGFGAFETPGFTYQNFGTGYLLEFSAPRWVQCAYNPPYPDEEVDAGLGAVGGSEGEDGAAPSDGELEPGEPGSWSCPQKPPELW